LASPRLLASRSPPPVPDVALLPDPALEGGDVVERAGWIIAATLFDDDDPSTHASTSVLSIDRDRPPRSRRSDGHPHRRGGAEDDDPWQTVPYGLLEWERQSKSGFAARLQLWRFAGAIFGGTLLGSCRKRAEESA